MEPEELQYTAEHEWVKTGEGLSRRVGITEYAAEQLGDIVYVSLPTVGAQVVAGDSIAELESTKSVSDVFSPVSGVVSAVNEELSDHPELVNTAPFTEGWLFEIEIDEDGETTPLLDSESYQQIISG